MDTVYTRQTCRQAQTLWNLIRAYMNCFVSTENGCWRVGWLDVLTGYMKLHETMLTKQRLMLFVHAWADRISRQVKEGFAA